MLSTTILKRTDGRRLKMLLAIFFLALAAPTALLIWQAYGQLKWEAYYQHRGMAEELTRRIDDSLRESIVEAENRSFADYVFLVLAGDPKANFLQRSPLAAYPVETGPPGVIGYFQVDADGDFSTPLLPSGGTDAASVGIDADEYAKRRELADRLRDILSDNRLVRYPPAEPAADADAQAGGRAERESSAGEAGIAATREGASSPAAAYSQRTFDELVGDRARAGAATGAAKSRDDAAARPAAGPVEQKDTLGRVADLKLEPAYRDKVTALEEEAVRSSAPPQADLRAKRTEQSALPESGEMVASAPFASDAYGGQLRISTFESEIDPLEFSMLDSGHFVLFRKVWRDEQRFIQGMLIDRDVFLDTAIVDRFESAALSATSDLVVAWRSDVLRAPGGDGARGAGGAENTLLYRSRLSPPLDGLDLLFTIRELPPGPGARVLGWVTLLLSGVLLGGFYALYRLAMGQLRLARQQQDFVSAVSHELKTPLTSIRMYGEMLKEGWAAKDKRQQYYEYIHDESERLTRLISNVLQLASITRNEPKLAMRAATVAELMNTLEEKIPDQAGRAGFEIAFDRDERAEDATVMIDEDCFLQIVINLVDNAVKFSSAATERKIVIASRLSTNGQVIFSVRDFGPGVPRNQMKKIFGLFYRSESELTRETVGTGIGLAIVHELTLAMNGSVDVVNRDPGADFRVSFPTVRPA